MISLYYYSLRQLEHCYTVLVYLTVTIIKTLRMSNPFLRPAKVQVLRELLPSPSAFPVIHYFFLFFSPTGATTHCGFVFCSPLAGLQLPHIRGFLITYNDVPQSVGLLWTSDQPIAGTST